MTLGVRLLLKDWQVTAITVCALVLCFLQGIVIRTFVPVSSSQFVLRSSVYFGAVQIGSWWELFVPIVIVLGIIFLNFVIAFLMYEKNRVLARFISWFSLLLALLLGASTYMVTTSRLISS